MTDTSARLNLLKDFVDTQNAEVQKLGGEGGAIQTELAKFLAFAQADGTGSVDEACVREVNRICGALASEYAEIAQFVLVVHDAVKLADGQTDDGVTTVTGDLGPYVKAVAEAYGLKWGDLWGSSEVKADLDLIDVGTVPASSGFVNDPVCTATGHLVIDARDFAMPPRLDVLSFRRTYASRELSDGAFGPGWWTWTECHSDVRADGAFLYFGPDAMHFAAEPDGHGGFITRPELDVRIEQPEPDRFVLHWGRRSATPYQRWTFAGGRLAEVAGPFTGTATFEHGRHGLSRIVHDSGRALTLHWSRSRVTRIESSDGRAASFRYDRSGRLVAVDNAVQPETYELDVAGRIAAIIDADGVRAVSMVYDDEGRVVEQTLPAGFVTRFGYDVEHRRTTLADGDHNPLSVYTHDERGRVEMYATGGGFRFSRRFDPLGRVASQSDPDGRSFTLTESYDGPHRTEAFTWTTGAVDSYTYDHLDRLVSQVSPGRSTAFTYADSSPFPTRVDLVGDDGISVELEWAHGTPIRIEDADGVVNTFDVRPDGTVASVANGYGTVSHFDVHSSGAVSAIRHADGRTQTYRHDDGGRLLSAVDAAGGRAEFTYSAAGRLLSVTDPAGSVTRLVYDDNGTLDHIVSADGVTTEFRFDDQQRPIGVRFANGDTIGLELDEFGRQVAVDVDGATWTTEREPSGRVKQQVDPNGTAKVQTYGEVATWSEITDAAGATSRVEMDLARRVTFLRDGTREFSAEYSDNGFVTRRTDASGRTAEFEYTPGGRVARVIEEDGVTECRYDNAGFVVATNSGAGWWTFDRDQYGRITRRVSPAGREQRYSYDLLGRVRTVEVDGAEWRYEYDPVGRVTRTIDPTGRSKSFTYDVMGRMVESRDGAAMDVRYAYDARGRIASMSDRHGGVVSYEHDAMGHLTGIVDQLGRRTVVRYDAAGHHVATEFLDADGTPVVPDPLAGTGPRPAPTGEFGGTAPLARSESADGATTSWSLPGGARVELRRDADGLAERLTSPGFERTFTRDACGRVVSVRDVTGGTTSTTSLRRDLAGRVLEQDADGVVTTYEYDDAGQLVATTGPDGRHEWEYDDLGRLAAERDGSGERRYEYDAAHRLVSVTDADGITTFEYDGRGRRVRARGRHDVVYVWGLDRLDAVITDGRWTFLDFDEAGRLARFGDTAVTWTDDDVPAPRSLDDRPVLALGASTFGTVADDGDVSWRPFRMSDAWGDRGDDDGWHDYYGVAADGIVWLGVRPYDVATRQFLSPDPLAPTPGGAGSASPYTYAANDPINLFDPTGRKGEPISIDDFNEMKDRRTGVQWGNVAALGVAVVGIVVVAAVTVATGGLALGPMIAIGAGLGLASGLAREGLETATNTGDGSFNAGPIVKDVLLGAAGGALGGIGGRLASPLMARIPTAGTVLPTVTRYGVTATTEAVSGAAEATVGELYDVTIPKGVLGSDGQFDGTQIAVNAGINSVVGPAADAVLPRVLPAGLQGPTGGVDPTVSVGEASPAPDLPDTVPDVTPGDVGPEVSPASSVTAGADSTPSTTVVDPTPTPTTADPAPATTTTAADPTPATAAADPAPAGAADPTPGSTAADPAPSSAADPTPSSAADPTPAGADPTPSSAADPTPAGADPTPATAAADPTPAGAADPTPGSTAADPTPSTAPADPTPAGAADPTPATAAADPTPASGADPTPATAAADPTPPAEVAAAAGAAAATGSIDVSTQLRSDVTPGGARPGAGDGVSPRVPGSTPGDATPGNTSPGDATVPPRTPLHRTPPGPNETDFVTVRPVLSDGSLGRPTSVPRADLQSTRPTHELDAGDPATFDGQQVQVGGNNIRITADANNRPLSAQMDISERFTAAELRDANTLNHQGKPDRDGRLSPERTAQSATKADGDAATAAGEAPNYPWSGGHVGGHQFFPDIGRLNMFPQELHLNTNGGYRQMEKAIAYAVRHDDVTVSASVTLTPGRPPATPGRQAVPPRIQVEVTFTGPRGTVTRQYDFNNAPANQQSASVQAYRGRPDAQRILAQIR